MAVEMAIWRMTDAGPHQLLDLEKRLEDMLIRDPGMSGTDLLIIGRQVQTSVTPSPSDSAAHYRTS